MAEFAENNIAKLNLHIQLERGQSVTLCADTEPPCQYGVRFESGNPSVAVVNEDGHVTALAEGRADITAKFGAAADSIGIDVKPSLDDLMKRLTDLALLHPFARATENLNKLWRWSEMTMMPDGVRAKAVELLVPVTDCVGFALSVKLSPPGEGREDICKHALGRDWRVFVRSEGLDWDFVGFIRVAGEPDVWSAKKMLTFPSRKVSMLTIRPPESMKGAFRSAYRLFDMLSVSRG